MRRFFKNLNEQQIEIGLYALLLTVLAAATCMVLWSSAGIWLKLWELTCAVLEPLVYGLMLGYALNPIVTRISRLLKRNERLAEQGRKRRTIAVIITVCLVAAVMLGLLTVFAAMLAHGISSVDWSSFDGLIEEATSDITGFMQTVQERLVSWGLISQDSESTLLSTFYNVKDAASTAIFTAIFTIYNLLDGDRLFAYFRRVAHNVLGDHTMDGAKLLDDADRVFSGYFRGQATDAFIVGVLSAIVLSMVGVPYAPVVGLLAGLGNLIPYVGGPVGFGSIVLVCMSEGAWGTMVAGIVAMAVVMFVDSNIINPKLLSENVEVHPMLVVAALIVGGGVGGIAGMLVAVPTAAWLKIQFDRWMEASEAADENLVDEIAERFGGER